MHATRTPSPKRMTTLAFTLIAAAIGGCSAGPSASMGQLSPVKDRATSQPNAELTLGAGDGLGRIVYVNDMILALGGKPSEFWAMNAASAPMLDGGTIATLPNPLQLGVEEASFATVPEAIDPGQ